MKRLRNQEARHSVEEIAEFELRIAEGERAMLPFIEGTSVPAASCVIRSIRRGP